jgi:hypothetical protein
MLLQLRRNIHARHLVTSFCCLKPSGCLVCSRQIMELVLRPHLSSPQRREIWII